MKNLTKKTLPTALSATMMFLTVSAGGSALAVSSDQSQSGDQFLPISEQVDDQADGQAATRFGAITATIQEINDHDINPELKMIITETTDGEPVHFVITDNTFIADEYEVGSEIVVYYDMTKPVITIYPPQLGAEVIALADHDLNLKVDKFDENLVSADGSLKLNLSDDTEIIQQNGDLYEGELENRELAVFYGPSTRSIPAQTTPEQIVVLDQSEEDVTIIDEVAYTNLYGTIEEINDHGIEGDMQLVTVRLHDGEEGEVVNFVISDHTYLDTELEVDSEVVGIYDSNAPIIFIYPPQYDTIALALAEEDRTIKVDFFDEELLSFDGSLQLTIGEETEIVTDTGEPFEGDLENQKLFVDYGIATLSIPAQTTPDRIVVLTQRELPIVDPPVDELTPVDPPDVEVPIADQEESVDGDDVSEEADAIDFLANIEEKNIVVNQQIVPGASAFADDDNVMVPLRPIAEALGHEITWLAESKSVVLGDQISLQIGEDSYVNTESESVQLGVAPVLVEGSTYVPLSFFREVAHHNNAYVFEDGIFIDDEEPMR